MSDLIDREHLELRLKDELDEAERLLRAAGPQELLEARLRYRRAIQRFSRLVMDGILPQE